MFNTVDFRERETRTILAEKTKKMIKTPEEEEKYYEQLRTTNR